ncbi:hypothetical protein [Cellvibrio sp. pealriver]|uniref:hypothetical protein n=1 Tax=Cellvibrio sp. pealriver TaxID=1622269 RepID=UPI00066FE92C|nr:hypothetical protein [Cellvibrio sp. pealriver]
MKRNIFSYFFYSIIAFSTSNAIAEIKTQQLDNGWIALTKQVDPFDSSTVKVIQIIKDDFVFQCGELNMKGGSYGFESLSFSAEIRYLIDEKHTQNKTGKYSTYLSGSDMVTDSRYYSFEINAEDINAMKNGSSMKVAGKYGNSGWETKSLNLIGFTSAYNMMCDK